MIATPKHYSKLGILLFVALFAVVGCTAHLHDWDGNEKGQNLFEFHKSEAVSAQDFGLTETGLNETHSGALREQSWDEYVITNVPQGTRYTIAMSGEESTDFDLWLFECGQWTGSENKGSNEAISIIASCTDAVFIYAFAFTGEGPYELKVSKGLPSQGVVVPCHYDNEGFTEIIADCGDIDIILRTLRAHQGGLGLYIRYDGQRQCGVEFYRDETFAINCPSLNEEVDTDNGTRMYQLIQHWADSWDGISLAIGANLTQILNEMNGSAAVGAMLNNNIGPGATLGVGSVIADVLGSFTTPIPENTRLIE